MNIIGFIGVIGLSAVNGAFQLQPKNVYVENGNISLTSYENSLIYKTNFNVTLGQSDTYNLYHFDYQSYDNVTFESYSFTNLIDCFSYFTDLDDGFGFIDYIKYASSTNSYDSYRFCYTLGYNLYNDYFTNDFVYFNYQDYNPSTNYDILSFDETIFSESNLGAVNLYSYKDLYDNALDTDKPIINYLETCHNPINYNSMLAYYNAYNESVYLTLYPLMYFNHYANNEYIVANRILFTTYINATDVTHAYHEGIEVGYDNGYRDGLDSGFDSGFDSGRATGYDSGYENGYIQGKADGVNSAHEYTFLNLFGAVADTPVLMIRSLFDFDFFGVNLLSVVLSLFTALIVFYLWRKIV